MKKILFLTLILFAGWKLINHQDEVVLGPGVMAPNIPRQMNFSSPNTFQFNGFNFTEVASFDIKAKVMAKKNYHFDNEAVLSPTDLALGWGRMSDESILEQIDISQSRRFYWWKVDSFPIPRKEIETHSANMHLIPSNKSVKSSIDEVRKGDIVKISGSLVNVKSSSGDWYWNTSTTRNDTGNGACEVIFVKKIDTVTP